jgi:hypothetical protein
MRRLFARLTMASAALVLCGFTPQVRPTHPQALATPTGYPVRSLCQEIVRSIAAMPRSTPMEAVPRLLRLQRSTRPNWIAVEPTSVLPLVERAYEYALTPGFVMTDADVDPEVRAKIIAEAPARISSGLITVQKATLDLDGPGTSAEIYRVSHTGVGWGTLGRMDLSIHRPPPSPERMWFYLVHSSQANPSLHDWPVYPGVYDNMELFVLKGRAYWISAPPALTVRRFVMGGGDIPICVFRL